MNTVKIKIVNEVKHKIHTIPPPTSVLFSYTPGEKGELTVEDFLLHRYPDYRFEEHICSNTEKETPVKVKKLASLDFYISDHAFDTLYSHCATFAQKGLEAMGFILGELREHDNQVFSVAHDTVTSNLESTAVSVRFHRDAFEDLFDKLDEIPYDYVILGWYHSHPGFSSFMSHVDVDTQKRMFNKVFHAALVIDPITHEVKAFRMQNSTCVEIPFAVFAESKQKKELIPVDTVSVHCLNCKKAFNVRNQEGKKELICPYCDHVFSHYEYD